MEEVKQSDIRIFNDTDANIQVRIKRSVKTGGSEELYKIEPHSSDTWKRSHGFYLMEVVHGDNNIALPYYISLNDKKGQYKFRDGKLYIGESKTATVFETDHKFSQSIPPEVIKIENMCTECDETNERIEVRVKTDGREGQNEGWFPIEHKCSDSWKRISGSHVTEIKYNGKTFQYVLKDGVLYSFIDDKLYCKTDDNEELVAHCENPVTFA